MNTNQDIYRNKSLKALFKNSLDAIISIDSDYCVVDINQVFIDMFGYELDEIKGKHVDDVMNMGKKDTANRDITTAVLAGKQVAEEGMRYAKNGKPIEVLIKGIPIIIDGKMAGAYGIYSDITERKLAEEKMRYLSFHDSLTGLYSRHFLNEEMNRLDTDRQLPISIIMADLNGLKLVNDTYGHAIGDEMLKNAASILKGACRKEDVIARWGGDEFVIILPGTSEKTATTICNRLMKNCSKSFVKDVPVSMALGIVCKNSPGKTLLEILKEAEDNMYKQKLTESRSTKSSVLKALLKTLEAKSFETEAHTRRMQEVAQKIGCVLNLPASELNRLDLLITLHDIGKINISEEILTKKTPLSKNEWQTIKKHPEIGYRIARATEEFAHIAKDILAHHERWDGKGYPQGLKGNDIPLLSRIIAIADAVEVMTNGRPYKKALSEKDLISELKRLAGKQFDPNLVELFLSLMDETT